MRTGWLFNFNGKADKLINIHEIRNHNNKTIENSNICYLSQQLDSTKLIDIIIMSINSKVLHISSFEYLFNLISLLNIVTLTTRFRHQPSQHQSLYSSRMQFNFRWNFWPACSLDWGPRGLSEHTVAVWESFLHMSLLIMITCNNTDYSNRDLQGSQMWQLICSCHWQTHFHYLELQIWWISAACVVYVILN